MSVVVVGAGVSGLTVADELTRSGRKVTILEQAPVVGGLCRSFTYGAHTFDVGPHRLFSANPELFNYFMDVLGSHANAIARASAVFMNNRFLAWPLTPFSLARLPPLHLSACFLDMIKPNRKIPAAPATLKDYVIRKYGHTVYRVFWEGYTRKFLGLPCEQIDACWAGLSVTRSVIDRQTQPNGLLTLLASTIKAPAKKLSFIYPENGMGQFPELLAARIKTAGQDINLNAPISAIRTLKNRVVAIEAAGKSWPVDELVWTGTLHDLCRLLHEPEFPLKSLSTILINVETDTPIPSRAGQWVYFPDESIVFSRISFPSKFNSRMAPPGRDGICVEVTTQQGSRLWQNPDQLIPAVLKDLARVRLLPSPDAAQAAHVERIPNTYPIYTVGFKNVLESVYRRLSRFSNLRLVGRQACFQHDNIDEAVDVALAQARNLLGGKAPIFSPVFDHELANAQ